MKTKDFILASLVTLNVFLVVALVGVRLYEAPAQSGGGLTAVLESRALAGNTSDEAGYFKLCPMQMSSNRDAIVVIDTATNQLAMYVTEAGKEEYVRVGQPIDLARAFGHPKR